MAALDSARTVDHMPHTAPPKRIHPARALHLVDAHATGVPTRFTLNTTVLAAGPASAASGHFWAAFLKMAIQPVHAPCFRSESTGRKH
jgi:hypothetical protein